MFIRKYILKFYLKIYFMVLMGLVFGSQYFKDPIVMLLSTLMFGFQIGHIFLMNTRILPSFDLHFGLTCAKTFFFCYFKTRPDNFMRIPCNVPLSLLCLLLLAAQFIIYRLQNKVGPRLKFLNLVSSEDGYKYFKSDELLVSNETKDCPICFEDLSEHIEFESPAEKLEQASLIVDYLGETLTL